MSRVPFDYGVVVWADSSARYCHIGRVHAAGRAHTAVREEEGIAAEERIDGCVLGADTELRAGDGGC